MVWMALDAFLLLTWLSSNAKITGMGKANTRLSRLTTMVFLMAFTAILVLKNSLKYRNSGLAQGLPRIPSRIL